VLDLLFPPNCFHCQKLGGWICEKCLSNVTWYEQKKLTLTTHPAVTHIYSVVEYRDQIEELLSQVKQARYFSLTKLWAQLTLLKHPNLLNGRTDVLVPVPTTTIRWLERGFSPTNHFADHLSKLTGVKVMKNVLVRTKESQHQANQNRQQRLITKNQYELARSPPSKNIWIIDDVITTGATVSDCARAFAAQGKSVKVLTFAVTI
jgi:competence protein ComFC